MFLSVDAFELRFLDSGLSTEDLFGAGSQVVDSRFSVFFEFSRVMTTYDVVCGEVLEPGVKTFGVFVIEEVLKLVTIKETEAIE